MILKVIKIGLPNFEFQIEDESSSTHEFAQILLKDLNFEAKNNQAFASNLQISEEMLNENIERQVKSELSTHVEVPSIISQEKDTVINN